MGKEYYINEKTYASCTNGVLPGVIRILGNDRVVFNKKLRLANTNDRFSPFSCKYAILLAVLAAVFIAALSFVAAFIIGLIIGLGICFIATFSQQWKNFHPKVFIQGKNALTDQSFIECPIGGVIKPTVSLKVAMLRAGVNFAGTLLDAALIYMGGKGAVQIFKNYALKTAIGYTAANFVLNIATDKFVTQKISKALTDEDPSASDTAGKSKEYVSYLGDGTPVPWTDEHGSHISRNAGDYDNFRNVNQDAMTEHTNAADEASRSAYQNTSGQAEGNRAYNQEMQRSSAEIKQTEKAARQDYKSMYKRMAEMEGQSGKAADKQARSQAMQAARRDAAQARTQAKQQAETMREQAINQAKETAAAEARTSALNNEAALNRSRFKVGARAGWGFFKSWGVGVAIGVANNYLTNKANKAIDSHAEAWQNEAIKSLGLNVIAVEK